MHGVRQRITVVRQRQQRQWAWQCVSWGLLAGALAGTLIAGLMLTERIGPSAWRWMAASLIADPLLGVLAAIVVRRPLRLAAVEIERTYRLKDRIVTAWAFLSRQGLSALQQLQVACADAHAAHIDSARVAPLQVPRLFPAGVLAALVALVLVLMAPGGAPVAASVADPVVLDQAARLDAEIEKLAEFNRQDRDPEVEQLLQQLAETLAQLKRPGVDPKEALARLSEMEAVLEAHQSQLVDPQLDAHLQNLGQALSLVPSLSAAGRTLERGEYDKAAAELEQQELPVLDRQTERSLLEKLERLQQAAGDGNQRQLKEAIGQTSAGLSQRNRSQQQMNLKGQESAEGDVDVETIQSVEQQQDAVRQYRANLEKYEQLSESVLDSEPIPLGRRQTIRRYFELIRPQASEVDQVLDAGGAE